MRNNNNYNNFEGSATNRRSREEEHESRSGSDNVEGISGEDQDADDNKPPRKKSYHRHTPQLIQELEPYSPLSLRSKHIPFRSI
ncbi:unnamed protein product [Brassica oleracea var. botrytis]